MRGIQKIKNKDGTYSYRAQVRLTDGIPQQSKSFPTLVEARTWKAQEETKRRQGMYFPSMTSKQTKLDELIDRYIAKVFLQNQRTLAMLNNIFFGGMKS